MASLQNELILMEPDPVVVGRWFLVLLKLLRRLNEKNTSEETICTTAAEGGEAGNVALPSRPITVGAIRVTAAQSYASGYSEGPTQNHRLTISFALRAACRRLSPVRTRLLLHGSQLTSFPPD